MKSYIENENKEDTKNLTTGANFAEKLIAFKISEKAQMFR